jgi:hypothetical protein
MGLGVKKWRNHNWQNWVTRTVIGVLICLVVFRPVVLMAQSTVSKGSPVPLIDSITVCYRDLDPQGKSIYGDRDDCLSDREIKSKTQTTVYTSEECLGTAPRDYTPKDLQSKVKQPVDPDKLEADMAMLGQKSNAIGIKKGQITLTPNKKKGWCVANFRCG